MKKEKSNLVEGLLIWKDRRPSWKSCGTGFSELKYSGHKVAKWFSLNVLEYGEKSSRQTSVTLDRDQLLELTQAALRVLGVDDSIRAKVVTAAAGQVLKS